MLKLKHGGGGGRFVSNHPKSSLLFPDQLKDLQNSRISQLITLKERVQLANDAHHITNFKKVYDRLFREFKEQLVAEYTQLRSVYIGEYEENFTKNEGEKQSHID